MANILELLRGVLTDADEQGAFREDPTGYLGRAGFADLTGEDVVEGILVVRRSLPDGMATALAPFEDEEGLPAIRPSHHERELDAAARVLGFAVGRVPAATGPVEPEPTPGAGDGEVAAEVDASGWEPGREAEREAPMALESELSTDAAATAPAGLAPITVDTGTLPSVRDFAASLAAAAADTRAQFDEAIERIVSDAEARAQATSDRYQELLRQAEADANGIRLGAEADVERIRTESEADRASARIELDRSRGEADERLHRARGEADDLRRQAEEVLAAARADAEAARHDIERRKAEVREAERQLKERLTGIDDLFRTVLRDDDEPTGAP